MSSTFRSIKRPASVLAATLTLFAASACIHNVSPGSLALDLSPLHREAEPAFHPETYNSANYNPATPPRFQANNALRQPIDRHPRHRAL